MTTVVIPNWNGGARLNRVLRDLGAQVVRPRRVIVVDNGSTDESPNAAEEAGAEVIRFGSNRGFAPAVNEGVRRAETPLVAILNNDLELDPNWLRHMEDGLARYKDASFASGKIFSRISLSSFSAPATVSGIARSSSKETGAPNAYANIYIASNCPV